MKLFKKKNKEENLITPEFKEFEEIYNLCKPYTMTGIERMFALYKATEYIVKNNIEGDFVECGVWRGGSSMVILKTLQKFNVTNRKIWLFDTYEGMSEPTEDDKDFTDLSADKQLQKSKKDADSFIWAYATLEDVKKNIELTKYPLENVHFIKGKVEDTIPEKNYFNHCSLLRLDTDWYESTKIELEYFYPLLQKNGVMIIDDYGHWQGCKKAVDEYFATQNFCPLLQRIDYTGRIMTK
ncbi:MAG TPA: TylF/MycF/NovP-related O-methyltransferase [Chitinophagaceae bacterium]|nr:TylF/MycF/NovP-related O-methyltransferase [Chitinophagaceae bacterium]